MSGQYEPTSRLTVFGAVGFTLVGLVLGITIARGWTNDLDSSEFEALGTWAAAFITLGALILAYLVHRREMAARAHDQMAESIREFNQRKVQEERELARRQLELEDARLVSATLSVGGHSSSGADSTRMLTSLLLTAINRSTEPATDVTLRTKWRSVRKHWLVLEPTSKQVERLRMSSAIEIPAGKEEARAVIQEDLRLYFVMHKREWVWRPSRGVTERSAENAAADEEGNASASVGTT